MILPTALCDHISVDILSSDKPTSVTDEVPYVPDNSTHSVFSPYHVGCIAIDDSMTQNEWQVFGFHFLGQSMANMTVEKCIDFCWNVHHFYFAATYYNETKDSFHCTCGSYLNTNYFNTLDAASTECYGELAARCTGDASQICGAKYPHDHNRIVLAVYKGTKTTEIEVHIDSHFNLTLNGKHLRSEANGYWKVLSLIIPPTRLQILAIHAYRTSNSLPQLGITINIDKNPIDKDKWRCISSDNDQIRQDYPDWYLNSPATFNDEKWLPPREVHGANKLVRGTAYWDQANKTHTLCRVKFGCPPRTFGTNCEKFNSHCKLGEVHPLSGHCLKGCAFRDQYGPFCLAAPTPDVRGKCHVCSHCKNSVCNSKSDEKTFGDCPKYWEGVTCKECDDGRWGQYCEKTCQRCVHCLQLTGSCLLQVCLPGYYGDQCQACPPGCDPQLGCSDNAVCTFCRVGRYGTQCEKTCSEHCDPHVGCSNNGHCIKCKAGFFGDFCGEHCTLRHCASGHCLSKDSCDGCETGWHSPKCRHLCPRNCNKVCSQSNGTCHKGCHGNYYGTYCTVICRAGCNGSCPQDTGRCLSMETKCDDGFYGSHCLDTCSKGCVQSCHKLTGFCDACKPGYYGRTCNDTCPTECPKKCKSWYGKLNGSTESIGEEFFQPFSQGSEQVLLGSIVVVIGILVVMLSLLYWYRSKPIVMPYGESFESKASKDDSDSDVEENIVHVDSVHHVTSPGKDQHPSQHRVEQDAFQEILITSAYDVTAKIENKSADSSQ